MCFLSLHIANFDYVFTSPKKNSVDSTQHNPDSQLPVFDSLSPNDTQDKKCDVSNSAVDGGDEDHHILVEMKDLRSTGYNAKTYLSTNVCPTGLTKREVRNIKSQAKTQQWDIKSKILFYLTKLYHS